MSSSAARERAALADLLDELGPDAPTLNDGWRTREMAAHLAVRERNPLAGPGLVIGALHPLTAKLEADAARGTDYAELVRRVRTGPPTLSLFALPGLRGAMELHEYYVHHEDVLRANDRRRELDRELEEDLWSRLRVTARVHLRRSPVGVELTRPDGGTITGKVKRPEVRVTGRPGELFLFAWGRTEVADVELAGDDEAVQQLLATPLGL